MKFLLDGHKSDPIVKSMTTYTDISLYIQRSGAINFRLADFFTISGSLSELYHRPSWD